MMLPPVVTPEPDPGISPITVPSPIPGSGPGMTMGGKRLSAEPER